TTKPSLLAREKRNRSKIRQLGRYQQNGHAAKAWCWSPSPARETFRRYGPTSPIPLQPRPSDDGADQILPSFIGPHELATKSLPDNFVKSDFGVTNRPTCLSSS